MMDPLGGQAGLVISALEGASPASNLKITHKPLSSDTIRCGRAGNQILL